MIVIILAILCVAGFCFAENGPVAPTPPMGWNSWDSYGTSVTEAQVKANADVMARDLAKYGWQYIVVDIQWYEPTAQGHDYKPGAALTMDEYGRLTPAVNRFPSAANGVGFKALADYVHAKGLKFGIHIMRGIPKQAVMKNTPIKGTPYHAADVADMENTCRWNPDMVGVDTTKPGSQAYYDSIAELYASWGVDYIKSDDMGSHLYQPAEMRALSLAMRKTGRPMVLSISPGPAPVSEAGFFQKYAELWRISDDFWDDWKLLRQQFDFTREWVPEIGKNNTWPDADMLPLGKLRVTDKEHKGTPSKFTPDEQRTVMTLWSMFRSPLIFGGDLPSNDEFTLSLITNPEVIAVNQHSSGNHESYRKGNFIAWTADVPNSSDKYLAVFNVGEQPETLAASWEQIGVPGRQFNVRDLWERKDLGTKEQVEVSLKPHAAVMYRLFK
jgi:alpha-galactosidase